MAAVHFRGVAALLRYFVLGLLAALLCAQAVASLRWRMEHDTPLFHYVAFLMDAHGRFPYRDVFETSMPGTFAFHHLVVKLFGYGDAAFRLVDLALLSLLLGATYAFMRRFGRLSATGAAVTFGLVYLSKGQTMSLQKDYLGVIPVACALACLPRRAEEPAGLWRFAAAGALFGLAVVFKPHLALGLPFVFGALVAFRWEGRAKSRRDFYRCAAACLLALSAPPLLAALWLYVNSALAGFARIFLEYLPLHVTLTGAQEDLKGFDRALYLFEQTLQFGGYGPLLLCGLFAGYHFVTQPARGRETDLSFAALALCALAYLVYPALGGKFWDYHFMPTAYFLSLAAGLCFFATPAGARGDAAPELKALLPVVVFGAALCLQLNLPRYSVSTLKALGPGQRVAPPKGGRVDEMAAVLRSRLGPADTVQPLDWANGAVHALLLARAPLATEFMYDYHFYHHTSSPLIQGLRREFLGQLRQSAPRFIVEVKANKPWFPAAGSPRSFPELYRQIEAEYAVAAEGDGYVIYERRNGPTAAAR
ncbi:MAG TPA: glycosyltransferase family 39 protein [Pyrinomonadaceae bacterium]|nr:glycosyltransferase family 39 protein [Pyrinomonadaceae bacterium]